MTLEQACEQAILEYAPYYRQTNAVLFGEHSEYIRVVIEFHRGHYRNLVNSGATEWTELPAESIQWMNANKPY